MAHANKKNGKHAASVVRSSSKDQSDLRDRLSSQWENPKHRELLENQGFEFQKISENLSVKAVLDSPAGPSDSLLEYDHSKYRLLKSIVTEGTSVVRAGDDGGTIPPADRLVLVTRSISVLEEGETKIYSEVFILERKD